MENYRQRKNENFISYMKRITNLKDTYGLSYEEWGNLITGGNAKYSNETCRKAYYVIEKMLPLINYQLEIDEENIKKYNDLHSKEVKITKEREKMKDVKREYFNLVRNESRWEVLYDEILDRLNHLNYNHKVNISPYELNGEETEGILVLSDWHIGMNINTPVNKYNVDIAKERMNKLIKDTIKYCKINNVTKLHVVLAGDLTNGVIHISSRLMQNENVIDQVLIASEMITDLVANLSQAIKGMKYTVLMAIMVG